jgi:hypothetical protein
MGASLRGGRRVLRRKDRINGNPAARNLFVITPGLRVCVQESDAAHLRRSSSAVIPRPGHTPQPAFTPGVAGPRNLPSDCWTADAAARAELAATARQTSPGPGGTTGLQRQTVDFSAGAPGFVRADGAVWHLLRNDIGARAQGIPEHPLRTLADVVYCPAGGCQSSTLFPSGSMTQANFPYSDSSIFSRTSQPSSRRAATRAWRSSTR